MHAVTDILERAPGRWGVVVRDLSSQAAVIEHNGDEVLRTASLGKLILLACVGSVVLENPEAGATLLDRRSAAPVSDSGIWQHLDVDALSVADIAMLVFMASDNLGTNVLLNHFGLERVRRFRSELGLTRTDLLDIVRDVRGGNDPETLSRGTAAELCGFMLRLARNELVSPGLSDWLQRRLSLNMDLGMVAAAAAVDPLAHAADGAPGGPLVANKTGSDAGVRSDAGIIRTGSRGVAYAAVCNYGEEARAAEILDAMRSIGKAIHPRPFRSGSSA